ncbi:MAG: hypothetical protein LBK58_06460, partial [Prevotellaceae bacterium]|nr:hypothetical protein [Prevotellaceae bacterium]
GAPGHQFRIFFGNIIPVKITHGFCILTVNTKKLFIFRPLDEVGESFGNIIGWLGNPTERLSNLTERRSNPTERLAAVNKWYVPVSFIFYLSLN